MKNEESEQTLLYTHWSNLYSQLFLNVTSNYVSYITICNVGTACSKAGPVDHTETTGQHSLLIFMTLTPNPLRYDSFPQIITTI